MQESKTTSRNDIVTSSKCALCGGTGESPAPFTKFFSGTFRVSEFLDKTGKKKSRVRLEIQRAFIEEAMQLFEHGEKVAMYIVPLRDMKKPQSAEDLGEMLE